MIVCGQCGHRFLAIATSLPRIACPRCGWFHEERRAEVAPFDEPPDRTFARAKALVSYLKARRMSDEEIERLYRGNMELRVVFDQVRPTQALLDHCYGQLKKYGITGLNDP